MRAKKMDTASRKRQMTEAALELIGKNGLAGMNVANIAKKAGVVPSAFYRHFANKEEAVDAVLSLVQSRLLDNVELVAVETTDPIERLRRLAALHIALFCEHKEIPRVIFSHVIYGENAARKKRVRDILHTYFIRVQGFILDGQTVGLFRRDIDLQTATVSFLGMIIPAAILSDVTDGEFDSKNHAEKVWPMFLRGIKEETQQF